MHQLRAQGQARRAGGGARRQNCACLHALAARATGLEGTSGSWGCIASPSPGLGPLRPGHRSKAPHRRGRLSRSTTVRAIEIEKPAAVDFSLNGASADLTAWAHETSLLRVQVNELQSALADAEVRMAEQSRQLEARAQELSEQEQVAEVFLELQDLLEELRTRNKELATALDVSRKDNMEKEDKLSGLQEQLASTQVDKRKADSELRKLQGEREELQTKLSKLMVEYADMEADVDRMRKQITNRKSGKGFGKAFIDDRQTNNLRQALRSAQEENEGLQQQLEEKEQALKAAGTKTTELQAKLAELEKAASEKQGLVLQLEAQLSELRQELKANAEAAARADSLQQQLEAAKQQLRDAAAEAATKVEGLQQQLVEAKQKLEEGKQKLEEEVLEKAKELTAAAEAKASTAEGKEAAEKAAALEAQVSELQQQLARAKKQLADAQEKLEKADKANTATAQQTQALAQVTSLQQRLEQMQQQMVEAAASAAAREQAKDADLERLGSSLFNARAHEAELAKDLATAKAALVDVQGLVRDMQSTNDELVARIEGLEVKLAGKGISPETLAVLQTELASKVAAVDAANKQAEMAAAAAAAAREEAQQLRMRALEVQASAQELSEARQRLTLVEAELQSTRAVADNAAAELRTAQMRLEEATRQVALLQTLEGQRASELEDAKEVYTILSREVERLRGELEVALMAGSQSDSTAILQQELEDRTQQLIAAETARSKLDADLSEARALIATLTAAGNANPAVSASEPGLARAQAAANASATVPSIPGRNGEEPLSKEFLEELKWDMEAEARATSELLARAEVLLMRSAAAGDADALVRASVFGDEDRMAYLEEQVETLRAELGEARAQIAPNDELQQELDSTRAEASQLRRKVASLEAELTGRDKQVATLLEATQKKGRGLGGNAALQQQLAALSSQVADLTAENTLLKTNMQRRAKLLSQARKFLKNLKQAQGRAGTPQPMQSQEEEDEEEQYSGEQGAWAGHQQNGYRHAVHGDDDGEEEEEDLVSAASGKASMNGR